jgi:magnesium transporter
VADVKLRWLDSRGRLQRSGLEGLDAARAASWCWVDVTDIDEATMGVLAEKFSLHPLAVEDVMHVQLRPKLDIYPDDMFMAWLTPLSADDGAVRVAEVNVFLSSKRLITVHDGGLAAIGAAEEEVARTLGQGPDWLLHAIIDRLVDSLLPIVDQLGDDLDDIEDDMLGEPRRQDLSRLYAARRRLVQMHRIVSPEREMLRELARERNIVSEDAYRYFQDVADHMARVEDSIETYRDVGASVMDIYLSAQSNRMNEIMKQLTVVATIFMPLTLLSGIYGMNLLKGMWPPETATWSFAAVIGSMLTIGVGMGLYFRRRNWW